jgi:hypothetical protein
MKGKKKMEENVKKNNRWLYVLLLITMFFNICFPKAGIKLSGIPLTIGNIFFFLLLMVWGLKKIKEKRIKMYGIGITVLFLAIYVILKYLVIYLNGKEIVKYISYIIPLVCYPFIYFITKDTIKTEKYKNKIMNLIVYGFVFICMYGVLQFFVGIGNCDIPGLTVNYSDYTEYGENWFLTKNNGVDSKSSKIVSTYQNGNLFGINMLIIYPIVYFNLKKNKKNKSVLFTLILFIICEFMTLSRACWLGVVLFVFLGIIFNNTFRNEKNSNMKKCCLLLCFIFSIIFVFKYLPGVASRFFNTDIEDWISMSGRTSGLISVFESVNQSGKIAPWFFGPEGIIDYTGIAYEMLPIALFAQVGVIGTCIVYYLFFKMYFSMKSDNVINSGIKLSLIIWVIVGIIECGFWLPPTALNLFFVLGLTMLKNEKEVE